MRRRISTLKHVVVLVSQNFPSFFPAVLVPSTVSMAVCPCALARRLARTWGPRDRLFPQGTLARLGRASASTLPRRHSWMVREGGCLGRCTSVDVRARKNCGAAARMVSLELHISSERNLNITYTVWRNDSVSARCTILGSILYLAFHHLPPPMPAFPTQVRRRPIHKTLNKHPALFGVPFLLVIVGSSFALSQFTQTKYDYQDQKTSAVRIHRRACSVKYAVKVVCYRLHTQTLLVWRRTARSSTSGRSTLCVHPLA
jgi:hypothetical protein